MCGSVNKRVVKEIPQDILSKSFNNIYGRLFTDNTERLAKVESRVDYRIQPEFLDKVSKREEKVGGHGIWQLKTAV